MREEMLKRILKRVSYCLEDAGALAPELGFHGRSLCEPSLDAARAVGCKAACTWAWTWRPTSCMIPIPAPTFCQTKRTRYTAAELHLLAGETSQDCPGTHRYIEDPFGE